MQTPIQSPFETGPKTTVYNGKDGPQKIIVEARALSPIRARIRDVFTRGATITTGGVAIYLQSAVPEITWYSLSIGAVGTLLTFPASHFGVAELLKAETKIVFTPTDIEFRSPGFPPRSRKVDRDQPHKFEMREHDWADREKERHEYLERKAQSGGRVRKCKRYFGKSYHIVLKRRSERLDIMTVYGRKKAALIHARLNDCDEIMGSGGSNRRGAGLDPHSDWSNQAGDLPE